MLKTVSDYINNNELFLNTDKIIVAVSGGMDSVVLLDLLSKLHENLAIAHCNFALRGHESDEDERFVRNLSDEYGLLFHTKRFETSTYARKHRMSIQEAARELRYVWFDELCSTFGYTRIAVGHHADDQIETFFINLLRGAGVAGLKAMKPLNGKVVRPLLNVAHIQIEEYAAKEGVNFREDSSNRSDKYLRNKIRRHLLPELEKIKENYRDPLLSSIRSLGDDHKMIGMFVDNLFSETVVSSGSRTIINADKLISLPQSSLVMYYMLKRYGFQPHQANLITEALRQKISGNKFFSQRYRAVCNRGELIIEEQAENTSEKIVTVNSAEDKINNPVKIEFMVKEATNDFSFDGGPGFAYFDYDKIKFPLTVRKWKEGDRFMPFGMQGSKLVSDLLIDEKVDRFKKEKVYVMESDDKISWVVGYRASNLFKVDDNTTKILVARTSN